MGHTGRHRPQKAARRAAAALLLSNRFTTDDQTYANRRRSGIEAESYGPRLVGEAYGQRRDRAVQNGPRRW